VAVDDDVGAVDVDVGDADVDVVVLVEPRPRNRKDFRLTLKQQPQQPKLTLDIEDMVEHS